MSTTKNIKFNIFGQSHSKEVGISVCGLPKGESVDFEKLYGFLCRRAPGRNDYSTSRYEADMPKFLSGIENGCTTGEELVAVIENTDVKSHDYKAFYKTPRPSHADYTALLKYGSEAMLEGGGAFSGRLTAPLCVAGGIALQILERKGIFIGAHILEIFNKRDTAFDSVHLDKDSLLAPTLKDFPTISEAAGAEMKREILAAKAAGDSVGGIIECGIIGVPGGIGGPLFDGIEGSLAKMIFGIPGVRGIEFGSGFASSKMLGSSHNDPFVIENGRVVTKTNHSGGVQGGITNGMPVIFKVAVKPTPSIAKEQYTVDLDTMTNTKLEIKGRHDPCILPRAIPALEAAAALALLDLIFEEN